MTTFTSPHHGGKLRQAAQQYQIPLADWLDLSTGVSPYSYPIPAIPDVVWNRLPEEEDGLRQAASNYYQHTNLLPVAGSQAAIQVLPDILSQTITIQRVLLPEVGYKEHQHAWQIFQKLAPHSIEFDTYKYHPSKSQLTAADVVVVINPNNPAAILHSAKTLLSWRAQMRDDATLIIDEAFIDVTPQESVLLRLPTPIPANTVILRSIGKFFGLAGARVGFCFASPEHLAIMARHLGPWTLSGPSRYVVQHALSNTQWHSHTRTTLLNQSQRMHTLLNRYFTKVMPQVLFQRVELSNATNWHQALAQQGIFTRLCDEKDALRFGLPHLESDWQKLESALQHIKETL